MSLDVRWLVPVAICAAAPQCLAARYITVEQARALIFPFADEFVARPVQLTPQQAQEIDRLSGVTGRSTPPQVWRAEAKGKLIGWLFVDQVIGKRELITYSVGINPDGSIQQVQVIEYLETVGSQVRYPRWNGQFVGKTARDPVQIDSDIENISGATLSSRHVTDGIRRLLFLHQVVLR
ncbi:MAG TPA: FMN-binding protein [Burkholderiales bacterium]|nr:FMN-binding protein [Burkholderiales bacterium]